MELRHPSKYWLPQHTPKKPKTMKVLYKRADVLRIHQRSSKGVEGVAESSKYLPDTLASLSLTAVESINWIPWQFRGFWAIDLRKNSCGELYKHWKHRTKCQLLHICINHRVRLKRRFLLDWIGWQIESMSRTRDWILSGLNWQCLEFLVTGKTPDLPKSGCASARWVNYNEGAFFL